jgi:hypothetical protein
LKEKVAFALFCRPKTGHVRRVITDAECSRFITKRIAVEWSFCHAFHTKEEAERWIPRFTELLWEVREVNAAERHPNNWWAAVCGNIYPLKGGVDDNRRAE